MSDLLTEEQKQNIRKDLVESARKLLGVKYEFGAEWKNVNLIPESVDCSELICGIYKLQGLKMPDESYNQFQSTIPTQKPQIGDLAFFGRGGNPAKIYHVGMVFDEENIIEARAYDPSASFETGKVILRPRSRWENYANFVGYTSQYKLI